MYKVRRLSSAAMLLHHPEATDCGETEVFSELKKVTFTRVMVSLWVKLRKVFGQCYNTTMYLPIYMDTTLFPSTSCKSKIYLESSF